jgi:hypothetical protein
MTGWVIDAAMNGEMFDLYIETQLVPTLCPVRHCARTVASGRSDHRRDHWQPHQWRTVVMLDNLSSHKSPAAAKALRDIGAWFLFRCPGKTPHRGHF